MRNLYIIITTTLLFLSKNAIAQNEGNNWYFSKNAELSFNTNPSTPINNRALDTADTFNLYNRYYSSSCELKCETIEWMNWTQELNNHFRARYKDNIVLIKPDIKMSTNNSLFSDITLSNLFKYFPKQISRVPTLWMLGNQAITVLKHKITLDSVKTLNDFILSVENFPNQRKHNGIKQSGYLRAFDKNDAVFK